MQADTQRLLDANARDVARAEQAGTSTSIVDRLRLTEHRIAGMAAGLRQVAGLPDPVGEVVRGYTLPNGLEVSQRRVPLGVVGIIYEARPNVTVDAAGLCLKSGNAVLLRGSASAAQSNAAIVDVLRSALRQAGLPADAVQLVAGDGHEPAKHLMRARGLVDVLIPRGGAGLIRSVVEESTVPVIETGVGNCAVYVDADADLGAEAEFLAVDEPGGGVHHDRGRVDGRHETAGVRQRPRDDGLGVTAPPAPDVRDGGVEGVDDGRGNVE